MESQTQPAATAGLPADRRAAAGLHGPEGTSGLHTSYEPVKPLPAGAAAGHAGAQAPSTPRRVQLPADDEEAELPPPQPPIVLPSSAAAVRVKEQQLGMQPPMAGRRVGQAAEQASDEEEEDNLDTAADAALAEQGPGLLQRAVDAASAVAASAVAAAGPMAEKAGELMGSGLEAVRHATMPDAEGGEGAAAGAAAQGERPVTEQPRSQQVPAAAGAPARPVVPAPAPITALPHAQAAPAAATTASMLPASRPPPATGTGYFPTTGATAPAPKPAPRPSGEVEARHVVAERLTGVAAEVQARPPPTPGLEAGTAALGKGKAPRAAGMDEDWVSELVEKLWPYARAAVEEMAWQTLPDILEQSEPSWIHDINLKKFRLGDKASGEPDLANIQVWAEDTAVEGDASVYLEADVAWSSKQDVELEIQVLPASMDKAWLPNFIENKLKDALTFSVGVEDAMLKGRLRLTCRPLLKRVPVVGAVQVSFVEMPELDFDLTLGNDSNVPMEPALKSWIKQTLQDSVLRAYTSPDHYFLQIDPQAQDVERPKGVLVVEVIEAVKVPRMDFFTRSSPFVELWARSSLKRSTSIKGHTKHPRWRETFELPIHVPEHQELNLVLFDYDWASANDEIGRALVRVQDLAPGQPADLWLDVTSESEQELAADKGAMGKRQRTAVAAAKPLRGGSTRGCRLHATYLEFSEAEQRLVGEGQRTGMDCMLASPQASSLDPRLRSLLQSGTLSLKVARADGLEARSLFGNPSVKGVVRAGHQQKELPAVKASHGGSASWDQPAELALGADATQGQSAAVTVELSSSGLMGGSLGRVRVPVRDILQRRKFSQGYPLEGGSAWGQVHLEIEWKPYF